jgi:pyruvate,water dikinase
VGDREGGTSTVELDEEAAASQVLDEADIARLVDMGVRLEEEFGSPQDIEWAFEGGELYVLQSRPITA